ncbi:hypothetical protein G4965_02755 [Blautia wexlerae]|uniref:hypothetical protein n=1 Tax=Blautia wexlerae TaxID=418240 RepID=UPI00157062E8|nr:hypothetical protein [Blautia wexlerae]NSF93607.1 hypothetical protein [Blautia wexlerae]
MRDSKRIEEKIKKVKIFLLCEKNIFLQKISKTSKKSLFANKKTIFLKKVKSPQSLVFSGFQGLFEG